MSGVAVPSPRRVSPWACTFALPTLLLPALRAQTSPTVINPLATASTSAVSPVQQTTDTQRRPQQDQREGLTQQPAQQSSVPREEQSAQLPLRVELPAPPTGFQRLVADSTGVELPIFGASLFSGALPSTFAPVDNIPVAPGYVIGPGDELRIQVYGQVSQQGTFVVDRTGDISFPDVGTIHVAGVTYQQLNAFLQLQLSRVFRNFQLNVNLGQLRSIQVFVVGEARRPGAYTVSSLSTLLNALFSSGGPLPQGSLRDIQVLRGGVAVVHFDLYDLLLHGDKSKDFQLAPGDVIFIPAVGAQAAIAGNVNHPAIYEIKPGDHLSQLLQLAGGETSIAASGGVRLERIFERTMRSVVEVNLKLGDDPALVAGDIVTVGPILNRYNDAVTLRGNVTTPGRYLWHPGMRIKDLVQTQDQLITREYYARRNALGTQSLSYQKPAPGALILDGTANPPGNSSPGNDYSTTNTNTATGAISAGNNNRAGSSSAAANGGNSVGAALTASNNTFPAVNDVVLSAPDIDWGYAAIERLDRTTLATSLIPFNPGALYLRGDETQNAELLPGDVVTFFSTADLKVPSFQQTRFVRLEGEFNASGVYSVQPGEGLRHLIDRAGGFTPQAYLYGSEFTRLSTRRVQQQRLAEYADNLEAQVSAVSAAANARATTDRDSAASASETAEARQAIARLRRIVPIGRIVLELKPDSRDSDSVPDIPLEDGDRFVVPRTPSTVSVEGQVYSANAFVFRYDQREKDYLKRAGGPDRQADRKRSFILRADGSVFSSQYGNVERARVFPGDTIIVPPQLQRRAILRNLIDISNIVGQFGLGAAAIEVLTK